MPLTNIDPSLIVSGMWKLDESVPYVSLIDLAREWSAGKDGNKYYDLHVRKCSKNQCGIGFKYVLDKESEYRKFFFRTRQQLEASFGTKLVGWDIAQRTFIVK